MTQECHQNLLNIATPREDVTITAVQGFDQKNLLVLVQTLCHELAL